MLQNDRLYVIIPKNTKGEKNGTEFKFGYGKENPAIT